MKPFLRDWLKGLFCVIALAVTTATAAPILNTECPVSFFTDVADRLLRASTANWINQNFNAFTNTFGSSTTNAFGVGNIPVYVNGQFVYTPAVQRLLQVSANIYDATTTNIYPTVFRPLFSTDGVGDVYITGYTNLNSPSGINTVSDPFDLQLSQPFDVGTIAALPDTNIASYVNIYGVPWIIGAKKGFPNFNEFAMENNLAVTRRLQLTRPAINSQFSVNLSAFNTNQMYMMSLSSSLGVELWNSYAATYPGTIVIGVNETASLTITNNDQNVPIPLFSNTFTTNLLLSINSWQGVTPQYGGNPNSASFLAVTFNGPALMNSVYRSSYANGTALPNGFNPPCLIPTNYFSSLNPPLLFETNSPNGFYLPQFGVLMTNRLQVFMLDFTNGAYHVIDYVHFAGPDTNFNMNAYLADNDATNNYVGVWDTNYPPGSGGAPTNPTYGIRNQISISKNGSPPLEDGLWTSDPEAIPFGTIAQRQAFFTAFFLPGNHLGTTTNLQLSVVAPYAPTRYIVQYLTWQANDPLVHYLASDIDEPTANNTTMPKQGLNSSSAAATTFAPLTGLNLGLLNDRYMPWGGQPKYPSIDSNPYNTALKDPLVYSSDNWNFPVGQPLNPNWIGQVHRGTQWQTIYLKSADIMTNSAAWQAWTGDPNSFDAAAMAPVQDWHLASLLASLFNTNNVSSLFSVNDSNPNDWEGLLNGLTALTNNLTEIDPLLISSNSSQAMVIADAIETQRAAQPGRIFSNIGDILATPQLAEQSPFINTSILDYNGNPVDPSDEVFEMIPSQLLSLLRTDSFGSIALMNNQLSVQFTGDDGHAYAIQASSDLVNWVNVSINYPVNGAISFSSSSLQNTNQQFYRSVLLQ